MGPSRARQGSAGYWGPCADAPARFRGFHFIENLDPADRREHKATWETTISFGELLNGTTNSPAFPDKEIAALVTATLRMLKNDLAMWHGNDLTDAQAEELMQKCFPE